MKCAALLLVAVSPLAAAQEMTHIDANTPRDIQIRLAKSAAPMEVSESADIYMLSRSGYERTVKGTNGFSCVIEREKPGTMEPECYDAEGTRTTFKVRIYVEKQRVNGMTEVDIGRSIKEGYKSGKFQAPSKPGIVYKLSDHNHVLNPETKKVIHFPGHLMFYAPYATEKTIGSGVGAPYIVHPGEPDALMIVVPAKSH